MTEEYLRAVLKGAEDEHCEFKEARNRYGFEEACEYCVALSNEGGGKLFFGLSDAHPRKIVGTGAFPNLDATKSSLLNALHFRIEVEELRLEEGRVIVFDVPSRPLGTPRAYKGRFFMRSGQSLVPMTADQLKRIQDESKGPDHSSEACDGATVDDLDPDAVEVFRRLWSRRSDIPAVATMGREQLLEDSELTVDGVPTIAALTLLGTSRGLGKFLGQAEVIWEYRESDDQIPSSQRQEYRQGFLTFHNELWTRINARNTVTSIRDGLFRREVPVFNEDAVREAILNAICHRDYRLGGSVFIRQFPKRLQITSPGGFPEGITPENIIRKQHPRNRRLAQACEKCGLVERSGQGMDRIFDTSLREGKGRPNFAGTDAFEVVLTLRGDVIDPTFVHLIELAGRRDIPLTAEHLLVLDDIRSGTLLSAYSQELIPHLVDIGLVERRRRGGNTSFILSRDLYGYLGETGVYTRQVGLTRQRIKALILQCIEHCGQAGARLDDFRDVLTTLEDRQIRRLVYELKAQGDIQLRGRAKHARWFLPVAQK